MLIVKGFIIGIGKIIPGVSGSVLAISMGLYDKIILSFSNFFKDVKRNFAFLIQILIGITLAMVIGSKVIYYFISNYYILTMFIISGFILGTIPSLLKKLEYNKKNIIALIISFLLTYFFNYFFKFNIKINFLTIVLLGIIESFTSIVPGISGTAIFINMNVYDYILNGISTVNIGFLSFYLIGIIIGLISFAKLINFLIEKHKSIFLSIVNGLVLSSLLSIIKICFKGTFNEIVLGLVLLIISAFISYLNT